jgi:iron(III) transport system permease protein
MENGLPFRVGAGLCAVGLLGGLITSDARVLSLLKNTVLLTAATCAISIPLGVLLALLLVRTGVPMRRPALVLLAGMLFVPLYLQAAAWSAGFGQLGWYSLSRGSFSTPILSGWVAAIWIHAVAALPWVVMLVAVALSWRESSLEDAARLDGSPGQVFTRVTLRRCLPAISMAVLWVALMTVGEMTVTDLYGIRTFAEELYTGFAWYENRNEIPGWQSAVCLSCCLAGLTVAAVGKLMEGMQRLPRRSGSEMRLRQAPWFLALFTWCLLLVVIAVPIANLVYKAGLRVELIDSQRMRLWSWDQFVQFVVPLPGAFRSTALWRYRQEFGWTVAIAASAATLVLGIAIPLALCARRGRWSALPAAIVMAVGAAFSGPLAALTIVWVRSMCSGRFAVWLFDETVFAPAVAAALRSLPLGILICWVALATLERRVAEAAVLDGARGWQCFLNFVVPLRSRELALAWLVAFAVAYGDLSASILVVPPGIMTLPMRVFDQLHAGVDDRVASICLTSLFGFFTIALLAVALFLPWMRQSAGRNQRIVKPGHTVR